MAFLNCFVSVYVVSNDNYVDSISAYSFSCGMLFAYLYWSLEIQSLPAYIAHSLYGNAHNDVFSDRPNQ